MSANLLFLIILAISIVFTLALNSASIKWGLKWTKIADISLLKAFGLYFLFILIGCLVAVSAIVILFAVSGNPSDRTLDLIGYGIALVSPAITITLIYKARPLKAALAGLPYLILSIAMPLIAIFVVRPYVYEAYLIPTNGMAPTILGDHWEAPCPKCGQPAYGMPFDSKFDLPPEGVPMVCSKELQTVYIEIRPQTHGGGDRILACKLLTPERWDLIVFRYPEDPSFNYVKRLVGLPGEKLEIRDGAVWINGEKLDPPESIRGIPYSPTIGSGAHVHSGPGSVPVELGPDEYFVLGDFVDQSADSRMWERGAPGHPPYAVPKENIVGVVINIYWPPSRWTSFR